MSGFKMSLLWVFMRAHSVLAVRSNSSLSRMLLRWGPHLQVQNSPDDSCMAPGRNHVIVRPDTNSPWNQILLRWDIATDSLSWRFIFVEAGILTKKKKKVHYLLSFKLFLTWPDCYTACSNNVSWLVHSPSITTVDWLLKSCDNWVLVRLEWWCPLVGLSQNNWGNQALVVREVYGLFNSLIITYAQLSRIRWWEKRFVLLVV